MGGHPAPHISDVDFVRELEANGIAATSRKYGISQRGIYKRRVTLEKELGRQITVPTAPASTRHNISHPGVLVADVPQSGHILIGGDAHYWPGPATTAHRAFVAFIKELRPHCVIMNGDVLDGATISRHPPIGWERRPTFAEELENAQERMAEIELVTPKRVPLFWPLGNHDARLETRIATVLPELAKLHGVHLKDHFSNRWLPCHRVDIGEIASVLHSFKGGTHATHNNTLYAGRTTITNHLHSQKVTPFTDLSGTRYGVDPGCLASIRGRQFDYVGARPVNWREGFAVLTFSGGKLLMPELVAVWDDDHIQWRGEIIKV